MRKPRIREPSYQYLLFAGSRCGTFDPAVLGDPLHMHAVEIGGYTVEFAHVEGGHYVRVTDRAGAAVFVEVFMCRRRERNWGWRPTMRHRFVLGRRPREMMAVMVGAVDDLRTATDIHVCLPSPNPDRYVRWFTEHGNIAVPWLGPSQEPRHALTVDRLRRRIVIRSLHEHDVLRMGRLSFLTLTHVRLKMMVCDGVGPSESDTAHSHDHGAQPRLVWSNGKPVESDDTHERSESWVAA